ncbi:hypothetical protein DXG01_009581 [Tephrocybe rancida]|nr:hypothetical protein DXG01_009581 [Tephrocybe rancida]
MADGGSHFDNHDVNGFCDEMGITHITTAAYAPWVNGLIEGANKLLLGRLKRLCAPNHDTAIDKEDITSTKQYDNSTTVYYRLSTPHHGNYSLASDSDLTTLLHQHNRHTFRYDAHLRALEDAERRKTSFDNNSPITTFEIGDLIQVYDSASDYNHKSINKIAPKWSKPRLIYAKFSNSFSLSTLSGLPLKGITHSRRMCHHIPLRSTTLDILHPRKMENPSQDDLEIAAAEEKMFDALLTHPRAASGYTP